MHFKHRQRILQFSLILFCCLFVAVTRTEIVGKCDTCIVSFWSPPPKSSWYKNQLVAVRIDDSWTGDERGYFREGIEKWNTANNCSGVHFYDFSAIHITNYDQTPPDMTLWWLRTSPLGVKYFYTYPAYLERLRAAVVPILPEMQNIISNSYFVYLGTHETGHTLDLGHCLAEPEPACQKVSGTCSIMGGESQNPAINTGGPFPSDIAVVDYVYCPAPCEQPCDLESCGYHCIPRDPCTFPENGGCPNGYSGLGRAGCCEPSSPVVVDVSGDGINLTDVEHGVVFDLSGTGTSLHLAWTAYGSDDAWLVLDRNHNGTIDNGTELFGNYTPQPSPSVGSEPNGFAALAEYDKVSDGGNSDGMITNADAVFGLLRLWQDTNHNGLSEPSELRTLAALGLVSIDLDYKVSKLTDEHGNQFRYRTKVKDSRGEQIGRWAWDVFLMSTP